MFLFKFLPQGLFCSEDTNSNRLISHCYQSLWDKEKFPPGRWKTKQSKNNGDHEQLASNSEHLKWSEDLAYTKRWFSNLFENFQNYKHKPHNLKIMTIHVDERKFGGYVLIMNLPMNANLSDTV